jgi:hypothetical protein
MKWKFLGIIAASFAFCAAALAQNGKADPFVGIWKARVPAGMPAQLIINMPAPDGYTSIRVNIGAENKNSAENHPVVYDEKPYATTGGDARKISYKKIDDRTVQRTQDREGKINIDTEQVSADGKTLTITPQGGMPRMFDKQFSVDPLGR